ncbi:MAG: DsbA family protein [Pyrobaculum sp.]
MRPSTIVAIGIAVILAIAAAVIYTKIPQHETAVVNSEEVPLPPWAISFGQPDATTLLIELYDLHCPYCAKAHEQLDPLYGQLIREGKLRVVFLDLVVHPEAVPAHRLLHCAYRELGDATFGLISRLYEVFLREGPYKQLELLSQYNCDDAPTEAEFNNAVRALLTYLSKRGVAVRGIGTPTFIVIKGGAINVVVGAEVEKVRSLLSQ